ncbi:putative metal cation transporter (plasmid) [Haloterrigena turkmenica DSM 5511]|uniref:Metal cation transporter n=1 Tax=Haloterrigena turkmenica (strain ATCC 51198 / DSM 5511 / JCM 9101 / NCIMB 13204 / VKM B-1734 / 4k) TaxID=543526 RepID=D2S0F8_HALTV|nr:metal transporter [Haloterrigena turkmenica]ADB62855.1 putative metal cation transporter [Haloterrigena turkmenica DSM 5511]
MTDKGEHLTTDGGVPAENETTQPLGLPRWVSALLPIVLLVLVLGVFAFTSPLAGVQSGTPLPDVTVTHTTLPSDDTVVLHVTNNGPESVTISQVLVDEAYWNFRVDGAGGDQTLAPMESAQIVVPYHWNPGWDLEVALVLSDGSTVHNTIVAPSQSPGFSLSLLGTLAVIGLFVGVIPVALGMLWFPYIKTMSDRWLHAVLLFAAGVLSFLAFDAGFEAFELAERVPGAYEGNLLVVFGIFGALLLVQAISAWREGRVAAGDSRASSGLWIAYLVAVGIGLHNLAEGLAIGSSFALGRVSLGAFLVIGFMLHNVTEGPAVVAPVARGKRPSLKHFAALGVIAGAPVILGGWIGSLAYSPTIGAFFLAIGVGAILQVNWEIARMVRDAGGRVASATNLLAFLFGLGVMYVTDLLVAL